MNRWMLKTRLLVVAVISLAGLLLLTALVWQGGRRNNAALEGVYEGSVRSLVQLQKLDSNLREIRFRAAGVLLEQLPVPGSLNHLRDTRGATQALWSGLKGFEPANEEQADLFKQMQQGWGQAESLLGKLERGYVGKDNAVITEVLESDWAVLQRSFIKPMQALLPLREEDARTIYESSVASNRSFGWWSIGIGLGSIALASGVLAWVARQALRDLAVARQAADRVSGGDLTHPIETRADDEIGQLLQGLGSMQVSLRHLVGQTRERIDSIAMAAQEIAVGNADLSVRTENSASNLQETAAHLQRVSDAMAHHAEVASQAHQLSHNASGSAMRSGEAVDLVVGTMRDIELASRQIGDIIGVIDGIAFQTNILALNAAVEAARAGEQGRGFAVVASEVRSLAQRSAEAAKQIKGLIQNSSERVESGVAQVGAAGDTIRSTVEQVGRVNELIAELAQTTDSQRNGIQQVSEAVRGLDDMTQQNAALVEQSAAAAESLNGQAQQLTELVSVFRVR